MIHINVVKSNIRKNGVLSSSSSGLDPQASVSMAEQAAFYQNVFSHLHPLHFNGNGSVTVFHETLANGDVLRRLFISASI